MTRTTRREPPGLTAEDLALWRHATSGDAPLRARTTAAPGVPAAKAPAPDVRPAEPPLPRAGRAPAAAGGVDARTMQRLRRGQIAVERRLDLHGMTQAQAHRAVSRALAAGQEDGVRCLLVITGKGVGAGAGVLRAMLPRWLAEPPDAGRVLAAAPARQRDGGAGAFYVLLRKSRRRTGGV